MRVCGSLNGVALFPNQPTSSWNLSMWPYLEIRSLPMWLINLKWDHTELRWALNPMTEVFMKERRQRRGRRPWQLRQGLEGCEYDPRKAKVSGIHQKLGRGKERASPWETSRGPQPRWHHHFIIPAPRTVGEEASAVELPGLWPWIMVALGNEYRLQNRVLAVFKVRKLSCLRI